MVMQTEEITLAEYVRDSNLQARLLDITQDAKNFPFVRPENFDLDRYQHGRIYLLRDLSLTKDPKDPRNIVGYNFNSYAIVIDPATEEKRSVVKYGPSAVLPKYRGEKFVPKTAALFTWRLFWNAKMRGMPFYVFVNAVNPWVRAAFMQLIIGMSKKLAEPFAVENNEISPTFLRACVERLYPRGTDPDHFILGHPSSSAWVPSTMPENQRFGTAHLFRADLIIVLHAFLMAAGFVKMAPVYVSAEGGLTMQSLDATSDVGSKPVPTQEKNEGLFSWVGIRARM